MDTKGPKELGKEIGMRQWGAARMKGFLREPPRRFRLVEPSLSEYMDRRLEGIDLPDPLPPVTDKDNHSGTVVWGRWTWDLPAGGREEAHDLAHRAGTLQKALEALRSDVQTLRDEVAG
ncbi:hypothetical protein [Salinibacter ruber]|uniref:hypothetical protein n=1 Tax=Salinibacter ruber TaxID=146919 RepID=UPI0021684DDD|nr:hypothetical protein [Salinibacter ruber]MCS4201453.1 hypothetical protein [Salinibacter ruber]